MVPNGAEFKADASCHQFIGHFVPKDIYRSWSLSRSDRSSVSRFTTRIAVKPEGTGPKNIQLNLVSTHEAAIVSSSHLTGLDIDPRFNDISPTGRPLSYGSHMDSNLRNDEQSPSGRDHLHY